MKKLLMLVYAACAMLVIIGSLLWFGFTLRSDSLLGKAEALKHFKAFTQRTADVFADQSSEDDSILLQTKLEQLCRNYQKYIRTVLIRDSAGILFSWPQNADIFSYTEQRVVTVKNLPLFFTAAQMHIPVQNLNTEITVHAALQTVPVETVFNRGRVVFFLLLLIVLLTIAALIFSYIDFKDSGEGKQSVPVQDDTPLNAKTGAETSPIKEDSGEAPTQTPDSSPVDKTTDAASAMGTSAAPEESSDVSITEAPIEVDASLPLSAQLESLNRLHIYEDNHTDDARTDTAQTSSAAASGETKPVGTMEEPAEIEHQASSNDVDTSASAVQAVNEKNSAGAIPPRAMYAENYGSFENYNQPQAPKEASEQAASAVPFEPAPDLYPDTSAAHSLAQATIIEELTTAITETSVAEEDLTLLLVHARGIAQNQQITHLLRGTLDRIHKVFTFNQDTLGLIVFYAPLDQGMQIANHLYDEVYAILKDPADKKSLRIGLTTRAGRLIPANRMIEEASAAIGKAIQEDNDPIVAFRVNPEKYRRCLARLS